ncbi:MAG: sulfite exporter TauE/SafE family protein [Bilophila wadsworthia]
MSGFTPLLFAYVFTAVFLAGIVRGATGFGFSMIMIVLLTLFFPPAQVAPVILFWEVLASIGHLPFVYKQVHWKSLRWLALGVALGTPFGVYCLVSIPVDAMRLIINAVVLILTSMLYCGLRPKNAPTPPQTTGVGLLAGVINGASANGGPPIILFFLSARSGQPLPRWLIAFFLFTDVWACSLQRGSPALTPSSLPSSSWFLCSAAWFSNRWFSTVDEARFRKVVLALLMIISVVGL